jgi:hypothetical protein
MKPTDGSELPAVRLDSPTDEAPRAIQANSSLALVRSGKVLQVDISQAARRYQRLVPALLQASGPRSHEVRAAVNRLKVALELFEQDQRRQNAEALRPDDGTAASADGSAR